ncbi:MAG: phosphoribosylaminoimidazolesuccinocarboxamide synthase [Micrococcales bacterium]|nr:MAG: phosphoribosylaminoimidazolesuccinocarboxamide synthase [Micrococcales bacterium]
MLPIEAVARGYLTGSGLADYRRTGQVCGVPLPAGLLDGSRLPEPVFTPASKAAYGEHDENIGYPDVVERIGRPLAEQVRELTVRIYSLAAGIARERGIIVADTKLEFGLSGGHELVLADEVLTPDSSRFWPAEEWEPGRAQPSFDKQIVRDWLTSPASGWRRESGQPPPALPGDVVDRTRQRYVAAYQRLTGRTW